MIKFECTGCGAQPEGGAEDKNCPVCGKKLKIIEIF